jgi:hypothetical protein
MLIQPPGRPARKGFLVSLVDLDFDHPVTPKVLKFFYLAMILLITGQCGLFFMVGLWFAGLRNGWAWGFILIAACPVVWVVEVIVVRIFAETVVLRFKGNEYLRALRDRPASGGESYADDWERP